jgi:Leucine-rich repeat (LRR) protein
LPAIAEINFSGNLLSEIPPDIGNLPTLKALDFSGNQLKKLPMEMGRLTELEYLNLKGNPILPDEKKAIKEWFPKAKIIF